jgi:hypothetical protein
MNPVAIIPSAGGTGFSLCDSCSMPQKSKPHRLKPVLRTLEMTTFDFCANCLAITAALGFG